MSRDWVALRASVRDLCHKVSQALKDGYDPDKVITRPLEYGSARRALLSVAEITQVPWPVQLRYGRLVSSP